MARKEDNLKGSGPLMAGFVLLVFVLDVLDDEYDLDGLFASGVEVLAVAAVCTVPLMLLAGLRSRLREVQGKTRTRGKARAEDVAIGLGWWIPRKYRDDLVGDILEDCSEMRMLSMGERRIVVHVAYQWLIGVVMLVPTAAVMGFAGAIRQIIGPRR